MKVLHSNAGYYLGYKCNECGPCRRDSDYFPTREIAEQALENHQTNTQPVFERVHELDFKTLKIGLFKLWLDELMGEEADRYGEMSIAFNMGEETEEDWYTDALHQRRQIERLLARFEKDGPINISDVHLIDSLKIDGSKKWHCGHSVDISAMLGVIKKIAENKWTDALSIYAKLDVNCPKCRADIKSLEEKMGVYAWYPVYYGCNHFVGMPRLIKYYEKRGTDPVKYFKEKKCPNCDPKEKGIVADLLSDLPF